MVVHNHNEGQQISSLISQCQLVINLAHLLNISILSGFLTDQRINYIKYTKISYAIPNFFHIKAQQSKQLVMRPIQIPSAATNQD